MLASLRQVDSSNAKNGTWRFSVESAVLGVRDSGGEAGWLRISLNINSAKTLDVCE